MDYLIVALVVSLCLVQGCFACDEAFVGGGWAGVYSAYRRSLVVDNPSTLCLFERSDRIGGRTYSASFKPDDNRDDEFVLDVGAYRFSPDMHLPGDLILHHLKLPTQCYEPQCQPAGVDFPKPFLFNYSAPLRRVTKQDSKMTAGYVTPIHHMVEAMRKAGVKIFKNTELIDIKVGFKTQLMFSSTNGDGKMAIDSKLVFLNLPRNFALQLPGVHKQVRKRTLDMMKCIRFDMPKAIFPHRFSTKPTSALSKVYVYYPDAWWITKINQTVGTFPSNAFQPIHTETGLYIGVHWSDGPTVCTAGNKECHGFLEVYYSVSNETFYSGIANEGPLGDIHKSDSQAAADQLDTVHTALLDAIDSLITVKKESLAPPTMMVVGKWNRPNDKYPYGRGYTAPTKVYYSPSISGSLGKACGVPGLTEVEYRDSVLQPFGANKKVFLVNNDWVAQQSEYMYGDWAEESLLQAERALALIGTEKPTWLDTKYYKKFVLSRMPSHEMDPEYQQAFK